MEKPFSEMLKEKANYKEMREEKYRADSRDRLSKILKKKIETTMIGALSSIEEHLGFLWNAKDGQLTEDQVYMKDLYQKVRSEILDKGNTQARNVDAELSQYDVKWLKYTIKMPVIKQTEEEGNA
ncbi:MAG: hypothetical protein CMM25_07140 [Rhodospirillaceae bacterium]|jgi:hypothetical protein|nr:hypothetical protein [Rhodospirillaceae bacterium]